MKKQELVNLIEVFNEEISKYEELLAFVISERNMYQLQLKNLDVDKQKSIEQRNFVNYVSEFYCGTGMYSEFFKGKLTRKMVRKMLPGFLDKNTIEFKGDSVDRENFRDYMMKELNLL